MKATSTIPTVKNEVTNFIVRLGKIFSNISILALLFTFCGYLSFGALAFVFIIGFCIIILSIGTVFIYYPNFGSLFLNAAGTTASIAGFFLKNIFLFAGLAVGGSIISLILLCMDKRKKHTARIVLSSIVIAIALIFIVLALVGV